MTTEFRQFDVAIIGLGPTGATLANLLGQAGISVLVLEREPEAFHLPRAVHFDDEVMRTFQAIGIADELERVTRLNVGMRFVDPAGNILLEWPRPPERTGQGWHSSYRMHQPDLETILRKRLATLSSVTVLNRRDAFAIDQDRDGAVLRYEDMQRGRVERVRARYVVGCDGARSLVRRYIETGMEDLGFHERWLVVDLLLRREKPELGDWSLQHCDPRRPSTYVRGPRNRRRWELTVLPDEDSTEIARPENVWPLLARWLSPDDAEIERTAVYVFHSLIAQEWRAGRLFLAGDSAHQTPPFMGQGMCAGIRDAANLSWKLIRALRQGHDEALLDSYQSERIDNARSFITTAVRLGGLINTKDPQAMLSAAFPRAEGGARMASIYPPLGKGLGCDDHPGLFGQPRFADGRWLDDVVGGGFALVVEDALWNSLDPELAIAARRVAHIAPMSVLQDGHAHLAAVAARAVILRPDRYIWGKAQEAAGLARILRPLQALSSPAALVAG